MDHLLDDSSSDAPPLRAGGHGAASAALATLLQPRPSGGAAAASAARPSPAASPACPTSRRRRSASSTCSSPGAPSQLDLFDYKPSSKDLAARNCPTRSGRGQRLTGMTAGQESFPVAPSIFKFAQHGKSGAWVSELLPHTAQVADDLCFIKSMHTEAINHDPAITFFQTGSQLAGRPSIGAWVAYGLGSENQDLPAFVVLISQGAATPTDQPLYDRLWGSGFLPTRVPGREVPLAAATRCCTCQPGRPRRGDPAPDARRPGELNQIAARGARRPGDRHPHRAVRDGLTACSPPCRN